LRSLRFPDTKIDGFAGGLAGLNSCLDCFFGHGLKIGWWAPELCQRRFDPSHLAKLLTEMLRTHVFPLHLVPLELVRPKGRSISRMIAEEGASPMRAKKKAVTTRK
jgi:hypothetical protein